MDPNTTLFVAILSMNAYYRNSGGSWILGLFPGVYELQPEAPMAKNRPRVKDDGAGVITNEFIGQPATVGSGVRREKLPPIERYIRVHCSGHPSQP